MIDNLDGDGAIDYSRVLCAEDSMKIDRTLNAPSRCKGALLLDGTALANPVRRARVVVNAENGTLLFTGYIATEPQSVYAGVGTKGPVYWITFNAISDEWLLDKQSFPLSGARLAEQGGSVLKALTSRTDAGIFTTDGVMDGPKVGVFLPEPAAAWSSNAGRAASNTYAAYRVLNAALALHPAGTVTHTLSDGDGSLQLSQLKLGSVRELANDVTVSGEMEPTVYVTELFAGDGTTAVFTLRETPFRPASAGRPSHILSDSFDQGSFNPRIWAVANPGSQLGFSGLGLAMSGGTGLDGQTTLTAVDPVEMGGTLVVEAGSLVLATASDGVICGLYAGSTIRENCFAGYNVRQSGGSTHVVPFVNGAEVGTALTVLAGHAYTLRIRFHCVETERVQQLYYAMSDGVIEEFGGGFVAAPMALVFELQDLGLSSNTPATVLYDGVVDSSPAQCNFVAVNSVQLFGSMGYCRLTQTGSVWVISTPPDGTSATRLIGLAGEGVDCIFSNTGLLTFLAGRVPIAGEIIAVTYRRGTRAVARLQNSISVADEGTAGQPGTACWLGRALQPKARNTVDCENAAQAILSFATSRSAAIAGSYTATNPADIWPGDVLALVTNGLTTSVVVRAVAITDGNASPEVLTYRIAFANEWAESLGINLSEAVAQDALLPQTALDSPANVLANLQQLQLVSSTDTTLQVDAGTDPPVGGGFEVRRRDWDFGPGVDQDLVLRSPVRNFSIPREGQVERYFARTYDASTPPVYSRFSSAIFTNLPVS